MGIALFYLVYVFVFLFGATVVSVIIKDRRRIYHPNYMSFFFIERRKYIHFIILFYFLIVGCLVGSVLLN